MLCKIAQQKDIDIQMVNMSLVEKRSVTMNGKTARAAKLAMEKIISIVKTNSFWDIQFPILPVV